MLYFIIIVVLRYNVFAMLETGVLYVVATPIGNLQDITLRALKVLEEVDWIAAEDTREAQKLFSFFQLKAKNRLVSYFRDNEARRVEMLLSLLEKGESVALVSTRGTPGISDPAYLLVRAALQKGLSVVPVPGPSSLIASLSVSGVPTDRFVFVGFLPRRPSKRRKILEELKNQEMTSVIYESPYRLVKTLRDILDTVGDREATVCRELTKKFEEIKLGMLSELSNYFLQGSVKGEFIIILSGIKGEKKSDDSDIR